MVLFSYYVLFNVGIFVIVWFWVWWVLNLLGFIFMFGIVMVWGVLCY